MITTEKHWLIGQAETCMKEEKDQVTSVRDRIRNVNRLQPEKVSTETDVDI